MPDHVVSQILTPRHAAPRPSNSLRQFLNHMTIPQGRLPLKANPNGMKNSDTGTVLAQGHAAFGRCA